MRTDKRRRIGSVVAFLGLVTLIGVPCGLTYRGFQRAKASAALIAAIEREDAPAAIAALDAGADPNATEGQKPASFSQALRDFWNQMRGPTTTKKRTALLLAMPYTEGNDLVGREDTRLIKALLLKGANVNARDNYGNTALILAASNELVEHEKVLLEHGADVNARDKQGLTALMRAAEDGIVESVIILLEHGADVRIKDNDGDTALSLAIKNGDAKVVALLKQAGAK